MKKIYKGIIMSLLAMVGFASCSDSSDYTPAATPTGAQVFFSTETASLIEVSKDASSFSITMNRGIADGSITVPLLVSGAEGTIYTIPNSVSFSDGAKEASLTIDYDPAKIEYGHYDTLTIAINEPEFTTPYGYSSIKVIVGATEWVDYGIAQYREDLMTTFFSTGNPVYNVPIQKSTVREGYYRLVNPYGEYYPHNEDGDYDPKATSYMTINATDPDWVYVEDCETTMDWGYGVFTMYGYVYYNLINGKSLDVVKADMPELFGTLKDGIITMPAGSMLISMADYNNGGLYYANNKGLFAIALPGTAIADLSVEVTYTGIYTDATNNVFAVGNLTLGEDVKTVKAIVVSESDDADAVADAIAAGDLEAVNVAAGRIEVPIADGLTGKLQIVAVVLDGDKVKTVSSDNFEYYGGGKSPWESIGTGLYVDDFVVPLYTREGEPYSYKVEIEENTETPGVYRIINAYAPVAKAFGVEGGNKNIEINASNPEGVYILEQSIGLDLDDGDISIVTEGGDYVGYYGDFDFVYQNAPELFGTLKDGVIKFPVFHDDDNDIDYQGYVVMGSSLYPGGMNGAIEIYLPEALEDASLRAKALSRAKSTSFEKRLNASQKIATKNALVQRKVNAKNRKVLKLQKTLSCASLFVK